MTEEKCPKCLGSGKLQDAVHDWVIVTCFICDGTGIKPENYDKLRARAGSGRMSGRLPYGIIRWPRSVWNEMQRDAAPTLDEIPKTYFCEECGHRHWIHSKIGIEHVVPKGSRETPANSIEAALRHHAIHGDMDGKTCLLAECALHYPQSSAKVIK